MIFKKRGRGPLRDAVSRLARRSALVLAAVFAASLVVAIPAAAQTTQSSQAQQGRILGTVVDVYEDPVAGATVALSGPNPSDRRSVVTSESGFFEFDHLDPAIPYSIVISAIGFEDRTSPAVTLAPGEVKLLSAITLTVATQHTTVQVTYDPVKIATEQIKVQETQHILGIIPNFLVAYDHNFVPLTPKLKFQLAFKVAAAPTSFAGVGFMAAVRQATDSPAYQQGWKGYGERFGAIEADSFSDIMFGAGILPSLLHQDPRYFYQGTGTKWSRFGHAIFSPFICRGDNGKNEPNYSSLGGDLASSALSDLYYPQSDRGAGLVFSNFALGTAERVLARVAQEFILARFTRMGGNIKK